jgi:MFS family permease
MRKIVVLCLCVSFLGGVVQMRNFLEKFFPVVYANEQLSARIRNNHSIYCQYNNQPLQAYVASISLAGAVSTLFASYFTRNYGRKSTLLFSGVFFIIGVILKTSAQNLGMLLVGRIITGFGSGFANQVSDDVHITTSSKRRTRRFYHKFSHFKGKCLENAKS